MQAPICGLLCAITVLVSAANAQNTPLRRYKANVHEGGACTPCIMHWPVGLKHRGAITRQRGHVVDLMAMCIELAGAKYPKEFDGKPILPHDSLSLGPVITGGSQPKDHVYYFDHSRTQAVIRGDWKIVRERGGPWRLYNLAENRTETEDLVEAHPEVVRRLTASSERWSERNQQLPRPMKSMGAIPFAALGTGRSNEGQLRNTPRITGRHP